MPKRESNDRFSEPRCGLILGGVRSGKSRLAERLARESGLPVTYLATATASDGEMRERIAAHRQRRPANWALIEEPLALPAALASSCTAGHCVLVECLTLWLANLLWAEEPERLDAELAALDALLPRLPGQVIFVGNEVNMGVIPVNDLARRYGDLAGSLHQRIAAQADQVVLTVAGLPLVLKGPALPPL
ncbi:bifunctional adenosylcobinamide kinase/adenosylcobinamide-phosphate guanylyltransferase [Lamprobacter modestohalophilus]|uniref:bifunctional adenosylcobinamide kinase/adenosylcobinamide-phosphate guanylyltransferase n=1 Tax=Lamprobacter modestohalophilus TaxID=1064514 RepID=UPI002ADEBFDE|nr:bifunctional adenosylcobinamide kinase/adenosylcobinamide-phosphate guanylyltransferase [Lamprobacter modestohalophilus]MEA1052740.1 bifunctional adenosylcobinamide kinase/adenosylcobinamide-phosphate guanylyltransferase [Lamprobacter modestohalophilus]